MRPNLQRYRCSLPFVCLSVHWELRCESASPYLFTQCTEPSVQIGTLP